MYSSASNVAEYTPGLLDTGSDFSTTTTPTKVAVERFLSAGCSLIHLRFEAAGYTTPITGTAAVYSQVVDLETLYAAGRAEMVRMTARVTAGERTRSQMFNDRFNKGLDQLLKMDLSLGLMAYKLQEPSRIGRIMRKLKDQPVYFAKFCAEGIFYDCTVCIKHSFS